MLNSNVETCFYFDERIQKWINDTYDGATNQMCQHAHGYKSIMGHIHPLRKSSHRNETNYYPSCEDIMLPIIQPSVKFNYILTPLGLFSDSYENDGYNVPNESDVRNVHNSVCRKINDTFFPIHNLTMEMRSDLTLEDVISMNNSNKIIFINLSCDGINYYVNNTIQDWGYPQGFTLKFFNFF
jgi:hypothetical protein